MTFQKTVDVHLKAIQNRDMDAFLETVTAEEKISLILPNGAFIHQRKAFVEFMRDWFSDPDWKMETELLRTVETPGMAFVLLFVTYNDLDQNGEPYTLTYYLNLVFAKENEKWVLVHDQNTPALKK